MKRCFLILSLFLIGNIPDGKGQEKFKVACIGFYNLENLFDTEDDPNIRDEEFTPKGARQWTKEVYKDKKKNLAKVISELGTHLTPDGVAVLGVAEVENRFVLEDLVKHPSLADRNYQVIHYDSPDERGIDVGLIYQPKYFSVLGSKPIPLLVYNENGERNFTRDILYVCGLLEDDTIHILVNHWPSRRGGEAATQPHRNAAALVCKNVKDSLVRIYPNAKVIVMGDLNDDPVSPSIKKVLSAKGKIKDLKSGDFFNPFFGLFKKGIGTIAYRDAWSLFDQIIISEGLVNKNQDRWFFYEAGVFNPPWLIQSVGQYKGYPFRTFDFDNYIGGYSDHFATYIFLVRKIR